MAQKYGPDVDDAISAALARGEQPSAIHDQLTRGTLDGLSAPVDMPRRAFRYRVQRIRERMAERAAKDARRSGGPSLAELCTWGHDEVHELADHGKSAREILDGVDWALWGGGNIPAHAAEALRFVIPYGGPCSGSTSRVPGGACSGPSAK